MVLQCKNVSGIGLTVLLMSLTVRMRGRRDAIAVSVGLILKKYDFMTKFHVSREKLNL